jgi:hypothetical protein
MKRPQFVAYVKRGVEMEKLIFTRLFYEGAVYTTREYPCGCRANGPGNVPAYCPDHLYSTEPVMDANSKPEFSVTMPVSQSDAKPEA